MTALAFLALVSVLLSVTRADLVLTQAEPQQKLRGGGAAATSKPAATVKGPAVVAPKKAPVAKAAPFKAGICPAPLSSCDLTFGGKTALKVDLQQTQNSRVITGNPVYTKDGTKLDSLSVATCVVVGEPNALCEGFAFFQNNAAQNFTTSALGTYGLGQDVVKKMTGKCLKLVINSFLIGTTWMNAGDNNKKFPAEKRCILIQT